MDLVKYDGDSTKGCMKIRKEQIENRDIVIYDDIFSGGEKLKLMKEFSYSDYSPSRIGSIHDRTTPTLKSEWSLKRLMNSGFLNNQTVKDLIVGNNLGFAGTYVNLSTASDLYSYHADSDQDGSLIALYYGNLDWKTEWEGETHFTDADLNDVKVSCGFIPGRLVLFDGMIPHKSSSPSPSALDYRYVLAVKFCTEKLINRSSFLSIKDFYFSEPESFTEREEQAISKIKELTKGVSHNDKSFFEHLYNVYCLLKTWGCEEDVCLSGLYHSIFGTIDFQANLNITEDEVRKIIGDYPTKLVKIFCSKDKIDIINQIDGKEKVDLLKIEYANIIDNYSGEKHTEETLIMIKQQILDMEKVKNYESEIS